MERAVRNIQNRRKVAVGVESWEYNGEDKNGLLFVLSDAA